MPIPFRLRVLQALTEALKEINPSNGYEFDLSEAVFRGRDYFGDSDPIPMVSILEAPDEGVSNDTPRGSGFNNGWWDLFIQGWVDDDLENPTDPAHYLMAEVKKRLAIEQRNTRDGNCLGLDARLDRLEYSSGVVRPPDAMSDRAYFWFKLRLFLVEDVTKPYD